jgi:hypothetical protein
MATNCCPLALKGHGHCINYRVKNKKPDYEFYSIYLLLVKQSTLGIEWSPKPNQIGVTIKQHLQQNWICEDAENTLIRSVLAAIQPLMGESEWSLKLITRLRLKTYVCHEDKWSQIKLLGCAVFS